MTLMPSTSTLNFHSVAMSDPANHPHKLQAATDPPWWAGDRSHAPAPPPAAPDPPSGSSAGSGPPVDVSAAAGGVSGFVLPTIRAVSLSERAASMISSSVMA